MLQTRHIRRVLVGVLTCLTLIGISAAYWAVFASESLLLRDDNPRRIEALARIQRGAIYDRHSRLLAQTVASDAGLQRRYLQPATYSLTGYYSLRYGVGGAEAAFDGTLAGASPLTSFSDYFNRHALRLPQTGADIRLTIDARIHAAVVGAMENLSGAAVVIDAKSGALLALVSQPSYDPNRLDADWSALSEAADNPFFNRALQGNYQLGGNVYALWLARAIDTGFELSLRFTGAADAIALDDGTIVNCLLPPASADLSLPQAFSFGCPAPFKNYLQTQPASAYDNAVATFRLAEPATLPGFPQPAGRPPDLATADLEPGDRALRNILGQGALTTTPLRLATIIAAIANEGVAITPWILESQRQPDSDEWRSVFSLPDATRLLDAATAAALQAFLRDSWRNLRGDSSHPSAEVGAYAAISRSGEESQLWLNGIVAYESDEIAAFVILLENSTDLTLLLSVGDALIEARSQSATVNR